MSAEAGRDWLSTNQDALTKDIGSVRSRLEALVQQKDLAHVPIDPSAATLRATRTAFGLSEFEASLLLLGAAVELDRETASLCGRLSQKDGPGRASFALASRAFDAAHWSALLPTAPLRYWRLMDFEPRGDGTLADTPLRIGERTLHHLLGLVYLDDSLQALVAACHTDGDLWPAHAATAARISRHLSERADSAVVLTGCHARARQNVVALACVDLHMRPFALRGEDIPGEPADRDRLARAWTREALLSPAVLLIEGGSSAAVAALADRVGTPILISGDESVQTGSRVFVRLELPPPTAGERRAWWHTALGERADALNGTLDALAAQFDLSPAQIAAAIEGAEEQTPQGLWRAGRLQARPSFGDLARRIEPSAMWDDLVLPPAQIAVLKQIAMHVRQRLKVYEEWGFGRERRGLGITALFAGVSGTGKTMASEVLAAELQLDLHRIDLSQVVSKYIGETERNLARVFDAADAGGVILLFDEADALFGKRSEVKDSHDRYANIEISYLLQRMEEYRGLAILTTNQRAALDHAFLRRLRFIVEFPFPDLASRAEIWRRVFPDATPIEGLEVAKLARLNVAGGNIRNIALNAAFLAADAGQPVRMRDVLQAARTECGKMDRNPSDAEIHDWT
jgi:hypothetical protein